MSIRSCGALIALAYLGACSSETTPADAGPAPDAAPMIDPDAGVAPDADPAPDAMEDAPDAAAPDASEPPPPDICDALGLARRPFDEGAGGLMFGDLAADFTAHTLGDGTWNLREQWTGCESYLFLVYYVGAYGDALFASDVEGILRNSAVNVHYFFTSYEPDEASRRARLEALKARVDTAIVRRFATEEAQAEQQRRVHYVTDRVTEIPGSVGAFTTDYNTFARTNVVDIGDGRRAPAPTLHVFGVDREQRWDAGGSLSEYVGGPVLLDMAGYLGAFYDFKATLAARLADQTNVETRVLVDTTTTARIFERDITLPNLDTVDTLELDIRIDCPARNPFGCSEWDRIADVQICVDEACAERHEIARWITPYWRRGEQRWAIDASPLLGLMRAGGTRRFRVETGPSWERATMYRGYVALRFSTQGGGRLRAMGAAPTFGGGAFDATYTPRAPIEVAVPASARRVELVTILSGHGQAQGNNCAEWCDHRHQFSVNGTRLPVIAPASGTGSTRGCAERADEGVPPGQWGNWGPQRAYWCPGLPVPANAVDVTAMVTPGTPATLDYSASFAGRTPAGGDIALSSYLVWYE